MSDVRQPSSGRRPEASVTVIGVDGEVLSQRAVDALQRADRVIGWPRHVEVVKDAVAPDVELVVCDADLTASLQALADSDGHRVLLASGDPGFFGIVRAVTARHDDVVVIPAVSSVAAAFAAAGLPWDDAHVVSAHGRPAHYAIAVCRRWPKVAVLTEPAFGPAQLGAALAHLHKRFIVAERLGHPDQRVVSLSAADAAEQAWNDPNVVVVLDEDLDATSRGWSSPPRTTAQGWALDDEVFEHRNGMITKAEVRALALAWLGPGLGDLIWDVGAGSGSVAIECARLGAAVIAVERDARECTRVDANAQRHDVPVEVVHGDAPDVLAGLPDPDAVFVGGGGEALPAIAALAGRRARRCVVAALATLERVPAAVDALDSAGLSVTATTVQAWRMAPLAGGHRLAATNPVFVIRGERL